jgi:hypothetical protein
MNFNLNNVYPIPFKTYVTYPRYVVAIKEPHLQSVLAPQLPF